MGEFIKPTKLVLKSVRQVFDHNFFIPAYQRGYRWTETQVTQLLNDIWQFTNRDNKLKGEFYCLQPVVVILNKDKWELIDGQQRITTLFLVIKYLEDIIKHAYPNFSFQPPVYETRIDSRNFLENIKSKTETDAKKNVDYWHIWNAYNTINDWFVDKDNNIDALEFVRTLLMIQIKDENGENLDKANNVRVIWYEATNDGTNNNYDIFTRLNIGKIPLTNAELIKALFLQKDNFASEKARLKQIQIASEWDAMEKMLQDDAFWYFIYNPDKSPQYDNRIEYIFDLMKRRTNEDEYYHTYNEFAKDFLKQENISKNKPDIDKIWLSIKYYFLTFEEWFKDYILFHYVGYLINNGIQIDELKEAKEGNGKILPKSKKEFKVYLKEEIKKLFVKTQIDNLDYQGNKDTIRKILLLFNIQTVLETQKSDMRFPFHKYKKENWDIEHVRSQEDQSDTGKINNQDAWVKDILDFFAGTTDLISVVNFIENPETSEDIKDICFLLYDYQKTTDKNIKKERFHSAYKKVSEYFKESESPGNINSISNLALLDATTNRSYGNAFFPIKRKRIIENDKNGIFVPICTKNLFLKYYSKKLGEVMFWSYDDSNDYLQAIKDTLSDFLPKESNNNVPELLMETINEE